MERDFPGRSAAFALSPGHGGGISVEPRVFATFTSSVSAVAIASSAASSLTGTSGSPTYDRPDIARVLASMKPT
jgi:hypothetical protein